MTQTILPWSLKGVSLEARRAAKQAAKEAGLPVGAWLCAVIHEAAASESGKAEETPAEASPGDPSWPSMPPYKSGPLGQ